MNKHLPQWIGYKLFCYNKGIAEGNYKSFKMFMEQYY